MPQDRESGNRARLWGFAMGQNVANHIGAILIHPNFSNEANWNNRMILIKAAHYGVPEIGATEATVDRIDAIVAALQEQDGRYTFYEVTPGWFRTRMVRSRSPKANHVMMRRCADVRVEGIRLGQMKEP